MESKTEHYSIKASHCAVSFSLRPTILSISIKIKGEKCMKLKAFVITMLFYFLVFAVIGFIDELSLFPDGLIALCIFGIPSAIAVSYAVAKE